jgi:acyl transferase domain-containing protein
MLPLAPRYVESLINAGVSPLISSAGPTSDMFSSVTMKKLLPEECTAEYWGQNMVSTVRFTSALTEAFKSHELDVLLEIGPHPALKGPAMDTVASLGIQDVGYFGSCFRNKPDLESILNSVGGMICSGVSIIPANINGKVSVHELQSTYEPGKVLVNVPSYQWDHSISHWGESRLSQNQRFREFPRHQLLGARKFNDTPLSMSWRNIITFKEVDWLQKAIVSDP